MRRRPLCCTVFSTATAKARTCLQACCKCNFAQRNWPVTCPHAFVRFHFFVCAFSALLLPSLCRCRRVCVVCKHSAFTYHVTFLHSQLQSGILVEALGPGVTTKLSNACPQQNKVQGMGSHTLLSLLVGFRAFLSLFWYPGCICIFFGFVVVLSLAEFHSYNIFYAVRWCFVVTLFAIQIVGCLCILFSM